MDSESNKGEREQGSGSVAWMVGVRHHWVAVGMYPEVGAGPYTVRGLMPRLDMRLRRFQEDLRGIWPILGEGYIAGKREHEGRPASLWTVDSPFGGGIECG